MYIGWERCKVNALQPRPILCYKCYDFRHTKNGCNREVKCARCTYTGHGENECNSTQWACAICNSTEHRSTSKDCPNWKFETEVLIRARDQQVSPGVARRQMEEECQQPSYAAKVKSQAASTTSPTSTQNTLDKKDILSMLRDIMGKDPSFIKELTTLIVDERQ